MRLLPNMENENDTELGGGGGIGREARSVVFDIQIATGRANPFPNFLYKHICKNPPLDCHRKRAIWRCTPTLTHKTQEDAHHTERKRTQTI